MSFRVSVLCVCVCVCSVAGSTPHLDSHPLRNSLFPTTALAKRYHELLTPVLRLVVGVQSSLAEDTDCADKVISFVEAHTELFLIILKARRFFHRLPPPH